MKKLTIGLLLVLAVSCTKRKVEIYGENNVRVSAGSDGPSGERPTLMLQERMAQGDIESTKALIDSLNAAQPPKEQQVLQQWVRKYVEWFNDQSAGNLTPAALQEYTCLAHIQADTPANRELLASYFNSLCNKVQQGQYREELLIEALAYTLQTIDSTVFEGGPAPLIGLGNTLLAKLDPGSNEFSQATYPTHCSTLYALHQALVLIQLIDASKWDKGIYNRFKKQVEAIAKKAQYYPVHYHARLLAQSLQRLERPQARLQGSLSLGQGLKGAPYLYQNACALGRLHFDLDAFLSGYECFQAAFTSQCSEQRPWYDWHQAMNHASLLSLEDSTQYQVFEECLQSLKDKEAAMGEKDRNALRFGVVQQLLLLALHGPTGEVRKKSIQWLEYLAKPEEWGGDPEVMEGLLDGLAAIAVHSKGKEKEQAEAVLESLTDSPEVPNCIVTWRSDRREAAAQSAITQWLGRQELSEKLRVMSAPAAASALGSLFSVINKAIRAEGPVESLPPAEAQAVYQALRAYYQQPYFAQVPSIFAGKPPKPAESIQCQLMLREQKREEKSIPDEPQDHLSTHHERLEWVKTPIALEDLFKSRSTKPGEAAREIQKVLLVGEAGTGKTTLSRKLAYSWAQGDWGKEFEAVYVLPVRALQQSQYDHLSFRREETLAAAIANHCFPLMEEDEYKRLRRQISEELEKPTTLLVLDGLDERCGASEKLLEQALGGRHKLLLLSRPYGIDQERLLVDLEIEHVGLSDAQMEAYVNHDLSSELGAGLLSFIRKYPAIEAIAHVPVNLQSLCALWQDDGAEVRAETLHGSLPGLYRKLMEYIWKRYAQHHKERGLQNKDRKVLFDTLGKIALRALQRGEVLISPALVREVLEEEPHPSWDENMLKESGLLQKEGRQYKFPHLTFQEYFAGRALARQLLSSDAKDQSRVEEFFLEKKYERQCGLMVWFLSGEVSKEQGVAGIRQLLSLLEKAPQEVVGVQHLCLQLKCLNTWLCVAGEDWEVGLAALEEEFQVMHSLVEWFREGLKQVRKEDEQGAYDRKLLWLLTTALQDSRAVAAQALALLELLAEAMQDSKYWVRRAASEALGEVVQAAPRHAAQVLPLLAEAMRDSNKVVRCAAISALVSIVQATPGPAAQVLPLLTEVMQDRDAAVRHAASKALGEVVQVASTYAAQVLPLLAKAMGDDNWEVRRAASEALVKVVQAIPEPAAQVLPLLTEVMQDRDADVRHAASKALGEVVQAVSEHAAQVLLLLTKAMRDDSEWVRHAASKALVSVVQAVPQHAAQVLPLLTEAMGDDNGQVRRAASEALGWVVQAAPGHTAQVLPLLGKAMQDSDKEVRLAASRALREVVQAAPEPVAQVLPLLTEARRDNSWEVRRAASEALLEVVQAVPQHAAQVLLLLGEAMRDSDEEVRRAASEVVQVAPEHAAQVLSLLTEAMRDDNWEIRRDASEALGEVIWAAPQHAAQVFPLLTEARQDSEGGVRSAAIKALGWIVQAAPEHAAQVLPLLTEAMQDSQYWVRSAASYALGEVVQAVSEPAAQVLPLLTKAMWDDSERVRRAASKALVWVVQATPKHAAQVLPLLTKAMGDDNGQVRWVAIRALVSVVQAVPEHAEQALPLLTAARKDSYWAARLAASEALREISLQQLIESYWATQHQALIPLIATQLYHTPLLVRTSQKPNHQRIVLYPTAGQSVEWEKPHQEVQRFVQQIKDELLLSS